MEDIQSKGVFSSSAINSYKSVLELNKKILVRKRFQTWKSFGITKACFIVSFHGLGGSLSGSTSGYSQQGCRAVPVSRLELGPRSWGFPVGLASRVHTKSWVVVSNITPRMGNDHNLTIIFFKWIETTNQNQYMRCCTIYFPSDVS